MGMLMFFTLGASMVGDVCDEDELSTGTRSEGTYYSVYWWFIKMGTAFASFVTGALLVFTQFDQTQNVAVDALGSSVAVIKAEAEVWLADEANSADRLAHFNQQLEKMISGIDGLENHFHDRTEAYPEQAEHVQGLVDRLDAVRSKAVALQAKSTGSATTPAALVAQADAILAETSFLKQQAPQTLFRLRLVEIGLPLALSVVSIFLTLRYPLTEARCYEIKEALKKRRAEPAT